MHLKHLKGWLDEVTQVLTLSLAVINLITKVVIANLKQVKHRQNLSVVGDEGLADSVTARDKGLQNLQGDCNNFGVASVQSSY